MGVRRGSGETAGEDTWKPTTAEQWMGRGLAWWCAERVCFDSVGWEGVVSVSVAD